MIKPILFNTEMVQAILEGRKTTTRRIVKPKSKNAYGFYVTTKKDGTFTGVYDYDENENMFETPQTQPAYVGDILWVRETWNICNMDIENNAITFIYKADKSEEESAVTVSVSDELYEKYDLSMAENNPEWRPSIFMPREATRIFLEVTGVRVERLQDITDEGCLKEGIHQYTKDNKLFKYSSGENRYAWKNMPREPKIAFADLWNSTVNKKDIDKYCFKANPYVWVIEFQRTERPDNFLEGDK